MKSVTFFPNEEYLSLSFHEQILLHHLIMNANYSDKYKISHRNRNYELGKYEYLFSVAEFVLRSGWSKGKVEYTLLSLIKKACCKRSTSKGRCIFSVEPARVKGMFDTPPNKRSTSLQQASYITNNIKKEHTPKGVYSKKEKTPLEKKNPEVKKPSRKFIKPTVEEIRDYALSIGYTSLKPSTFYDHYEGSNWERGKTKIKNWKAVVRTWRDRELPVTKGKSGSPPQTQQKNTTLARFERFGIRTKQDNQLPITKGKIGVTPANPAKNTTLPSLNFFNENRRQLCNKTTS